MICKFRAKLFSNSGKWRQALFRRGDTHKNKIRDDRTEVPKIGERTCQRKDKFQKISRENFPATARNREAVFDATTIRQFLRFRNLLETISIYREADSSPKKFG